MKNIPDICQTSTESRNIVFVENNRRIKFVNDSGRCYLKIKVDGCVITGMTPRCDDALCSEDGFEEHYIELKGTDIRHAIEQLKTTIERIGEHNENRHAYVICSNVAPQINTMIQKAKSEFEKKYKSTLLVKSRQAEVSLPGVK